MGMRGAACDLSGVCAWWPPLVNSMLWSIVLIPARQSNRIPNEPSERYRQSCCLPHQLQTSRALFYTGGRPRTDQDTLEQAWILYLHTDKSAADVRRTVGIGRRTLFSYLAQVRG